MARLLGKYNILSSAMIPENEYKERMIYRLNQIRAGWFDGDKEPCNTKKADMLNRDLKIAIEIKDDLNYQLIANSTQTTDLTLMNQRYADHVRSANSKFKNYVDFKTILLFRSAYPVHVVKYVLEGLDQFRRDDGDLVYHGKVGKYSKFAKNEVGGFLVISDLMNRSYYFSNKFAKPERILTKQEVEVLFGWEITEVNS